MNKNVLLLVIPLLIYINGFTQDSLVNYRHVISRKSPYFIEDYYVLKSDKNVKHGEYKKLTYKKKIIDHGYYSNGLKDSTWLEYVKGHDDSWAEGEYDEGKKKGQWNYYIEGKLIQTFDHDKDSLVFDVDTTVATHFIGGSMMYFRFLNNLYSYPEKARNSGIKGNVFITFTIDEEGYQGEYKIMRGAHPILNQQAMKMVKAIPARWHQTRSDKTEFLVVIPFGSGLGFWFTPKHNDPKRILHR